MKPMTHHNEETLPVLSFSKAQALFLLLFGKSCLMKFEQDIDWPEFCSQAFESKQKRMTMIANKSLPLLSIIRDSEHNCFFDKGRQQVSVKLC